MKPNKKQIEANLRNKMAKVHDERMERLEQRASKLARDYKEMCARAIKAEQERDDLKDKVKQLEDWVERLHEYMGWMTTTAKYISRTSETNSHYKRRWTRLSIRLKASVGSSTC